MPQWLKLSTHAFNEDYETDNSLDIFRAEGKSQTNLEQIEFILKHFMQRMGQRNYIKFIEKTKVWVAGDREKMIRGIVWYED